MSHYLATLDDADEAMPGHPDPTRLVAWANERGAFDRREALHLMRFRARIDAVLAAGVGEAVTDMNGPLTVAERRWTPARTAQAGEAAGRAYAENAAPRTLDLAAAAAAAAYTAALGAPAVVILTADGRGVDTSGWCACAAAPAANEWVRYERFSGRGREAHGFACPDCRRITQTG